MLKPQASFPAPGFNKQKKKAIILYLFCQRFEDVDRDNPFRKTLHQIVSSRHYYQRPVLQLHIHTKRFLCHEWQK
jgi:hypothetical protein